MLRNLNVTSGFDPSLRRISCWRRKGGYTQPRCMCAARHGCAVMRMLFDVRSSFLGVRLWSISSYFELFYESYTVDSYISEVRISEVPTQLSKLFLARNNLFVTQYKSGSAKWGSAKWAVRISEVGFERPEGGLFLRKWANFKNFQICTHKMQVLR